MLKNGKPILWINSMSVIKYSGELSGYVISTSFRTGYANDVMSIIDWLYGWDIRDGALVFLRSGLAVPSVELPIPDPVIMLIYREAIREQRHDN